MLRAVADERGIPVDKGGPVSKDCDLLSVRDAVHTMCNQLTAIRGNAQLLIRRLESEAGDGEPQTDACQTIIEQTQLIEIALARLIARSPQLLSGMMTPSADRVIFPQDLQPPQGERWDASPQG